MSRSEFVARVFWRSSWESTKGEPVFARLLAEDFGVVGCGEGGEEGLHGGGQGVVMGIGGCKEGIAAGGRKSVLIKEARQRCPRVCECEGGMRTICSSV